MYSVAGCVQVYSVAAGAIVSYRIHLHTSCYTMAEGPSKRSTQVYIRINILLLETLLLYEHYKTCKLPVQSLLVVV